MTQISMCAARAIMFGNIFAIFPNRVKHFLKAFICFRIEIMSLDFNRVGDIGFGQPEGTGKRANNVKKLLCLQRHAYSNEQGTPSAEKQFEATQLRFLPCTQLVLQRTWNACK